MKGNLPQPSRARPGEEVNRRRELPGDPAEGGGSPPSVLARWMRRLGSPRLTVVLLAMACVLVFAGTLAQVKIGIQGAQERYFRSLLVYWTVPGAGLRIPVFPGGYAVGAAMLLNLIGAGWLFGSVRRRPWLWLAHIGLAVILLGQLAVDTWSVESFIRFREGEERSYSEHDQRYELALIDTTDPDRDQVWAIPQTLLARSKEIRDPRLPFVIRVRRWLPNSVPANASEPSPSPASRGVGARVAVQPAPPVSDPDRKNVPSAYVELLDRQGRSLGTWLVSGWLEASQEIRSQDRLYRISLRPERFYFPFRIKLIDFIHENYPGTSIPKYFASRVRLVDSERNQDRTLLIYMNHPLRYRGWTFYQAGYDEWDERVSILQAVRNPAWITPYLSCALVSVGLAGQFATRLWKQRRNQVA